MFCSALSGPFASLTSLCCASSKHEWSQLRPVHIKQMESVVSVWTQLICLQRYVAFYFIHHVNSSIESNTNVNSGLGIFWIWSWVLNVGLGVPWLFELTGFCRCFFPAPPVFPVMLDFHEIHERQGEHRHQYLDRVRLHFGWCASTTQWSLRVLQENHCLNNWRKHKK